MHKGESKGFLQSTLSCKLVVSTHFSRQEKGTAPCTRSESEHHWHCQTLSTARALTSSEQMSLRKEQCQDTKGCVATALRTWGGNSGNYTGCHGTVGLNSHLSACPIPWASFSVVSHSSWVRCVFTSSSVTWRGGFCSLGDYFIYNCQQLWEGKQGKVFLTCFYCSHSQIFPCSGAPRARPMFAQPQGSFWLLFLYTLCMWDTCESLLLAYCDWIEMLPAFRWKAPLSVLGDGANPISWSFFVTLKLVPLGFTDRS